MTDTPTMQRGTISLAQLTISTDYQIRKKMDPITVSRYENILKSGGTLPPVKVAIVDGVFTLIDGFHRIAARERLGEARVDVVIVAAEANRSEALWLAASANLEHGLPLKPAELREVFRAYIRTRRHIVGRGQIKSYREIGQEIGKPHTTCATG